MNKKTNYGWVMAALAFAILFVGSYAQYQLPPLSYLIMPQFNLSSSQFSSIFSAAMIPGMCLSLISGLLCDKLGVKKCITAALIITTLGIVLRVFTGSYVTLLICMILAGFASTFMNSNIAKYLGGWFAPEKIGTMIGLTMAGSTLAMAIGMGTTAMFPSVSSAYVFAAAAAVVILILWLIFGRKSEAEKAAGKNTAGEASISVAESLKEVLKNKYIWFVGICLMLVMAGVMALSAFLPMALQELRSVSAASAGLVTSIVMFGNLGGTVLGPLICAKTKNMKVYLIICAVIAAAGTAFAWRLPAGIVMNVALFITGFATSGMLPVLMSLPIMVPGIGPRLAGTAGGFVSTIQLFGCVVIPTYIIAKIAGDNYSLILLLGGVCCLLSICGVIFLPDLMKKDK